MTPPMTPETVQALCEQLRAKATKATPGPWKAENAAAHPSEAWGLVAGERCIVLHDFIGRFDAEFIAACDPQTILSLCDHLESLLGEVERLTAQVAKRRACNCAEPDPVQQADRKFYCYRCGFETGARPNLFAHTPRPGGTAPADEEIR